MYNQKAYEWDAALYDLLDIQEDLYLFSSIWSNAIDELMHRKYLIVFREIFVRK